VFRVWLLNCHHWNEENKAPTKVAASRIMIGKLIIPFDERVSPRDKGNSKTIIRTPVE